MLWVGPFGNLHLTVWTLLRLEHALGNTYTLHFICCKLNKSICSAGNKEVPPKRSSQRAWTNNSCYRPIFFNTANGECLLCFVFTLFIAMNDYFWMLANYSMSKKESFLSLMTCCLFMGWSKSRFSCTSLFFYSPFTCSVQQTKKFAVSQTLNLITTAHTWTLEA